MSASERRVKTKFPGPLMKIVRHHVEAILTESEYGSVESKVPCIAHEQNRSVG